MSLFDIGVATIFAREFLEGGIIIGNYRTVINKSDELSDDETQVKLRAVNVAVAGASLVAIVLILAVAIPLDIASKQFDNRVAENIEGVSKLVAAVAILGLSLKIPVWLGVYEKNVNLPGEDCHCCTRRKEAEEEEKEELVTVREIRFNVAQNIWREVAGCGVFLLPYFLQRDGIRAIPLSALIGIVIALVITIIFFVANARLQNKTWIAIIMCTLTCLLPIGLFAGGCHEFEEVLCLPDGAGAAEGEGAAVEGEGAVVEGEGAAVEGEGAAVEGEGAEEGAALAGDEGEGIARLLLAVEGEGLSGACPAQVDYINTHYCTPAAYCIEGKFWDVGRFPMALFKPFGYSHKPTVLQIASWWAWFALTVFCHGYKWHKTRQVRARKAEEGKQAPKV